MVKKLLSILMMILLGLGAHAQVPADTVTKHSPVRTITDAQYNALIKGIDLNNMAYVAELNHYPLPDQLIKFKKELDLSPSQITAINSVVRFLQMKKLEVGQSVIRNERTLDSLFRTQKLDEGTIIFYGNRYGLYQGEYRSAVLQACFRTQKLLSERQLKKYEALLQHN
jgi:hypothetical protein